MIFSVFFEHKKKNIEQEFNLSYIIKKKYSIFLVNIIIIIIILFCWCFIIISIIVINNIKQF